METITSAPETPSAVQQQRLQFVLQLADTSLVLGHRLSEWCGHGPVLEQDIAMANIGLDLLGQARSYYQYAAELEGLGRTEDDLAFLRAATEYRNPLLVEQPNGDFAATVLRQFLFDSYHLPFLEALRAGPDEKLAAIAEKSAKEAAYHRQWSAEWVIRLGDGTPESRRRLDAALRNLWRYTAELTNPTPAEAALVDLGLAPNLDDVRALQQAHIAEVFTEATVPLPAPGVAQKGGKTGRHSEHLGYLLAELQYMQRAYPGLKW